MDAWDAIARSLEQNRNEMKWQESVARTAAELRAAYLAGREGSANFRDALRRAHSGCALPQGDGHP